MKTRIPIKQSRQSKYRAVRVNVDGILFHSKREANRYCELKILRDAKKISPFELQVRFPLQVPTSGRDTKNIGVYIADFYYVSEGKIVVEDVKGFRTPLYRWKKKHFEAQYGIKITEV